MKKVFERLSFMVLGVLLASAAYLVGNTDKTADAKLTTFDNVIVTGSLIVKGPVLVGDVTSENQNYVHLQGDETGSTVLLFHNRNEETNDADAALLLSTSKANEKPLAGIRLRDKNNNASIGTSAKGWYKEK